MKIKKHTSVLFDEWKFLCKYKTLLWLSIFNHFGICAHFEGLTTAAAGDEMKV